MRRAAARIDPASAERGTPEPGVGDRNRVGGASNPVLSATGRSEASKDQE